MPSWKLKSALHRLISRLPYPRFWNELLQKYVTGSIRPTEKQCEAKVQDARRHLGAYRRHCPNPRDDFSVLDLGTGWSGALPASLALAGARQVWTCDVVPLLSCQRVWETFVHLVRLAERGVLQAHLPVPPVRLDLLRRLTVDRQAGTAADLLGPLGVRVLVGDARAIALPDASCDLAVSVDCVNEIAEPVLAGILARFRTVLAPGGVLSLGLELGDLYSYFDRSITPFNFLRYTDEEWSRLDSPLTPQNRLRIADYRRLLRSAGFEVAEEQNTLGNPEDLDRFPLAPRFRAYPPDDLLVTRSWMTAV